MSLVALLPGALGGSPILDAAAELPLGTILVLTEGSLDAADLALIPCLREHSPWTPLVLLAADTASPFRDVLPLLAGGGGYIAVPRLGDASLVDRIRLAVATRDVPLPEQYHRLIRACLGPGTAGLVRAVLTGGATRSTRARLQRASAGTPSFWHDLHRVVDAVTRSHREGLTLVLAADAVGVEPRTLSRCCRRAVGADWRTIRSVCGWESIVMLGMRRQGMVPRDTEV